MNNKKIMMFAWVALLTVLLIGCGGGSPSASTGGDTAVKPRDQVAAEVHTGDAAKGETVYQQACLACHGADAKGIPNLGKDLTASEFVKGNSDTELLAFVKTGRPVSDPNNTTGIDMPPKGGNPALTDEQITDIIAFIRTLEE